MANEPINDDLVTIKIVTTLGEAEIAAAVLEDNGIRAFVPNANASAVMPHLFTAINTWGVKVQVMARDAQAAGEVLGLDDRIEGDAENIDDDAPEPDEPTADQYARRAKNAACIGLLFTPILFYSIYCAFKASVAKYIAPPRNRTRYRLNMLVALVILLLHVAIWVMVAYMFSRPDAYMPGPGIPIEGHPIHISL